MLPSLNFGALHFAKKSTREFFQRHRTQIAKAIIGGDYRVNKDGLLICGDLAQVAGRYIHQVIPRIGLPGELVVDHNLLVSEGIQNALDILLFTEAKISNWYLALFNGGSAPGAGTNASNVASSLAEITSTTEGYTQTTRPAYVGAASSGGISSNLASMAAFTIITASSVNVVGGFLISDNARGGTAGKLLSAAQFGATRTLFNGETFSLGYQLQLTN